MEEPTTTEEPTTDLDYTRTTILDPITLEPSTEESSSEESTDSTEESSTTDYSTTDDNDDTTTDYPTTDDNDDTTTPDYESTTLDYPTTGDTSEEDSETDPTDYPTTDDSTTDDDYSTDPTEYPDTTDSSTTEDDTTVTTEEPTTEDDNPCPPGVYGNVAHPELCNSFYLCVSGQAVELQCAGGFEFDPELRTCVEIAPGGCTLGDSTEPTTDSSPTTDLSNTTPDPSLTTTEAVTPPELCPIGMWGNIPHEYKCNSFYMCAAGNAIQLYCSEGFEFDPEQGTCVLIAEGGCTYSSTTTTAPISAICPPGTWGNVPHPEICNAFYMCAGEQPIPLFCPEGFEFDPELKTCVQITEGGCTYNQGTTSNEPETTTVVTNPEESDTTTVSTTLGESDTTTVSTTVGESDPTVSTTVGESDPTTIVTIPGEIELTTVDVASGESDTTAAITTSAEDTDETTVEPYNPCPLGVFGNVPHPELCNVYFLCLSGRPLELTCADGFEFDRETRECVLIAEGGCTLGTKTSENPDKQTTAPINGESTTASVTTEGPAPICPPGQYENVAHPELCNSFYTCAGGTPVQLHCSEGFEFDPETKSCVPIAEGGCTLGPTTTPEPPTPTTPVPICPPGQWGNVADPIRCDSFYMCAGGNAIQLYCSEGFEFDPEQGTCIAISEGGCTLGSQTTPAIETTTGASDESSELITEDWYSTTEDDLISDDHRPTTEQGVTSDEDSEEASSTTESIPTESSEEHATDGSDYESTTGDDSSTETDSTTEQSTTSESVETTDSNETTESSPTTEDPSLTTLDYDVTTGSSTETTESTTEIDDSEEVTDPSVTTDYPDTDETTDSSSTTIDSTDEDTETEQPSTTEEPGDSTTDASYEITDSSEEVTESSQEATTEASEATTEAPICPAGVFGNVPHPDQCNAFYLCTGGAPIPLTCSEGHEFDPELLTCVQIAEGGCTLGNPTTTPEPVVSTPTPESVCPPGVFGNIPHPEKCRSFYMCAAGQAILLTCSEGLEFDAEVRDCVPITEGGCTLGPNTETTPDDVPTVPHPQPESTPESSESSEMTPVPVDPTSAPESEEVITPESVCPPGIFGNVPHPTKCNAFYMCAAGQAILLTCTEGHEFEPLVQECVPITEGGCTLGLDSITTPDDDDASDSHTQPDNTSESTPTTSESFETTSESSETTSESEQVTTKPTQEPDSAEVTESTTEPTNTPVPEPTTTVSDNIEAVTTPTVSPQETTTEDKITTVPIPEDSTTQSSENTEAESTTSDSETTLKPTETTLETDPTTEKVEVTTPVPICPPGVFGNVPHPELCHGFYMCANGFAMELLCSEGFEFDPESRNCVVIAEGGCTLGPNTGNDSDGNASSEEQIPTTIAPDAIENETTVAGDDADIITTVAPVVTTEGSEVTTPTPICAAGQFGNIAHPEDCESFYMCANGNVILLHCSEGFEFSTTVGECVRIAEGGCKLGGNPATVPPTTQFECPDDQIGNVADPARCDAFYDCSGSSPLHLLCAAGFEFDSDSRSCVEIAEGGCTLGSTLTTNPTPELTTTTIPTTISSEPTTITPEDITTTKEPTTEATTIPTEAPTTPSEATTIPTEAPTTPSEATTIPTEAPTTPSEATTIPTEAPTTPSEATTIPTEAPTTTPEAPTTEAPICEVGVFGNLPDPERCDFFYRCIGVGDPLHLRCPDGFEYDHSVLNCIPIAEGGCTLGTTAQKLQLITSEATNTTSEEKNSSLELDASFEELLATKIEAENKKKKMADIACPLGVYGNMPDPEGCESYYFCAGEFATQMYCSTGFEFDPELKSCVQISHSGCTAKLKEKTM